MLCRESGTTALRESLLRTPCNGRDIADQANKYFDEAAIWDRALSPDEILSNYLRLRAVKFYVRSGLSSPPDGDFVGPDGTGSTYYDGVLKLFASSGGFDLSHPFAQYKATFESDALNAITPSLLSVSMLTSLGSGPVDYTVDDFSQGSFVNVTNAPRRRVSPFLGLAKQVNGGFPSSGAYVSRPIDVGVAATWTRRRSAP